MENPMMNQYPETAVTYDYRMYDRIWQRVSPDLNPYPGVRAAANCTPAASGASAANGTSGVSGAAMNNGTSAVNSTAPAVNGTPAVNSAENAETVENAAPAAYAVPTPAAPPAETQNTEPVPVSSLPGADMNPCCMGTDAQQSLEVLTGFIDEELAERRCCLTLCQRMRNNMSAVRLLRRIAAEKQCAAKEMCTAYYLITGTCYTPAVTVEHMEWENSAAALRFCYHQEACNGFNYRRAAEGTLDPCLQKLFKRMSEQSYRRAEEIMALLGQILCR
ncbi:MAG: hypothetical protein K2O18_01245 [Oscillospiraceae bacterium]|nr:hypothetical protein [Oscillospiraceae bacterium]